MFNTLTNSNDIIICSMIVLPLEVIGWDLTRVAQRLGSSSDTELHLVVNKRPRHSVPFPLKKTLKANRPLAKIIPGSQATETAGKEKQLFKVRFNSFAAISIGKFCSNIW